MTVALSSAVTPEWSAPIAAFAAEQNVEELLPQVWEMTRRLFPSAQCLEVILDEDPEIANDRHVLFDVEVNLSVATAVEAEQQWCRELRSICPSTAIWVFRLAMRLIP